MPLRIKCPSGHSLIVSESRAGQSFRCPKCQAEVRVPAKEVPPPPDEKPTPVKPLLAAQTKKPPVPLAKETLPAPKSATLSVPAPTAPTKSPVPPPLPEASAKEVAVSEPPPPVVLPPPEPEPAAPPVIVVSPPPKSAALAQSMLVAKSIPVETAPPSPPPSGPLPFLPLESRLIPTSPEPPAVAEPPPPTAKLPPIPQASVAPHLPTSPSVELPPPLIHSPQQVAVVFQLAAAMIVAALFSVFPSAWDLVVYVNGTAVSPVGRWAIVLAMLGAVQVAYAIYLIQLPDWTTVWIVTLFALASAALYAMALGLTIISGDDGWLVRFLQLSDKVAGGKAALWCLCMMSVMTLLAFFAGRISVRWRQAEAVLRGAA